MGIKSMDVEKEISQIRNDYVSSERIRKRSEYEKSARGLLSPRDISNLSWDTLDNVISLIDSDFWKREEVGGRFFPLFSKPNRNRIHTNDIEKIKEFLLSIFKDDDLAKIDEKISKLTGIGYGFASLLFYINDKARYNVFLRVTAKGIRAAYPGKAKTLKYGSPFDRNYRLFNELCGNLKRDYSLQPEELDIILTVLGKRKKGEIVEGRESDISETVPVSDTYKISGHVEAEAILIRIGNLLGYETYTADPSKVLEGKKLEELSSLREIPEVLQGIKNARKIDVIWHNESSPPNYLFEVEDKGTMRDALHRLYQARHHNARFFVVGPKGNRNKFEEWMSTAPYNSCRDLYNFRTFGEISMLYNLIKNTEEFKERIGIV